MHNISIRLILKKFILFNPIYLTLIHLSASIMIIYTAIYIQVLSMENKFVNPWKINWIKKQALV